MLQYLDNSQNAAGHINENYAREIMELHTLGVGSGYTQNDVQQLARILTGMGVNTHRPAAQDAEDPARRIIIARRACSSSIPTAMISATRHFLGATIKGDGIEEVDQGDRHPGRRAAHRALCLHASWRNISAATRRPIRLIQAMAATWLHSDGDIAQVLRTLFASPEFKASLGQKFKDPIHYAVSALARRLWPAGDPQRPAAAQLAEPHGRAALRP